MAMWIAARTCLCAILWTFTGVKGGTRSYSQVNEEIQEVLSQAKDEEGMFNLNHFLRAYVQDPLPIPTFNVSLASGLSNFKGQFQSVNLSGLRDIHVESIQVNLAQMNLTTVMFLPVLRFDGDYDLQGKFTFFPITGGGKFWMNVSDITITMLGSLEKRETEGVEMSTVDIHADQKLVRLHFENLGGSEDVSDFTNNILNQLGNEIFENIKVYMLASLRENLKTALDAQLERLPRSLVSNESVNILDAAIKQAAIHMRNNSIDPLPLVDHTDTFFQQMLFLSVHGEASIYDGNLFGLSTIQRTGNVEITYRNNAVVLEANLGFTNLSGGYEWKAHLMGVGPSGYASVSVRSISAYIQMEQALTPGSKPRITNIRIERIRQIWVDINGLGTWDFVLEILVNLVTNSIKMSLAETISEPVRQVVQKELDSMPLTLI